MDDFVTYSICVVGAHSPLESQKDLVEAAATLGKVIASSDCNLLVDTASPFGNLVSASHREHGGMSIGFSPAANKKEHIKSYKLPTDVTDIMIYSGFGFNGADIVMTRSADAAIIAGGTIEAVKQYALVHEEGKPLGILESKYWDSQDMIKEVAKYVGGEDKIVFAKTASELVKNVLKKVK
jgi:predicted Rossmann-fold nucleotide-binding protein